MIIRNSLVLLLPHGKPPFMGISYEGGASSIAETTHRHLVKVELPIDMQLWLYNDQVKINLIVHNSNYMDGYSNVSYTRSVFDTWINKAKEFRCVNFGHVIEKNGVYEMVKVRETTTPLFFPIRSILVIENSDKLIRVVV